MTVVESNPAAQRALGIPSHIAPVYQSGPGAKVRILATADRLFYHDGIRTVGIDRLIKESAVTKATFYKHYGSKDRLILEYLRGRHRAVQEVVANLLVTSEESVRDNAEKSIRSLVDAISDEIHQPGFRGCPFINAAAEFADPRSPAREIVSSHRDWYTEIFTNLLKDLGHDMPGDAADELILARDGAMTGGYASDPVSASAALHRVAERLLSTTAS